MIQALKFLAESDYKVFHAKAQIQDKGHLPGSSDYRWTQEAVLWSGTRNIPVVLPQELKTIASFPGANWVLKNLDTQLWSNCPALTCKLKGMGWFNPTDVGNSSKEGRGNTKTGLSSGTCLEVARLRKSIPTLCPWKRGNSLGSVNSKAGIWAPACGLLIQETWSNRPRLAPPAFEILQLLQSW